GHQGQAETEDRHRGRRPHQIDATEPQPAETTARRRPHQHAGPRYCRRHNGGELTWTNSRSSRTSSATTISPPTVRRSPSKPKLSNCAKSGNRKPPAPRRKAAPLQRP